jgi:hypothetical protein
MVTVNIASVPMVVADCGSGSCCCKGKLVSSTRADDGDLPGVVAGQVHPVAEPAAIIKSRRLIDLASDRSGSFP